MSQHPTPAREAAQRERGDRHVGEAVARTDAPAKVTGQARYVRDIEPDAPLVGKLVTSPYAHAKITRIDTTAAEELDGVAAVVTHRDVPDAKRGAFVYDQPILASERVRYAGEPVAIVAAESAAIADRAVSLVEVEYDELDGVFDLRESFSKSPPAVVHDDVREYEFATQGDPRYGARGHLQPDDPDYDRPNVLYRDSKEVGDVEGAFAGADHVFEDEYEVKAFQHCSMEPHVAIAHRRHDGMSLYTSHQVPHNVEKKLSQVFPELDPASLRVRALYVGGGFGGKITAFTEVLAVAIARKTTRPVRLAFTRAEEFTTGVSRPQVVTRIRDGVTDDGDLVARELEVLFNLGAYNEQVFRCTVSATDQVYGAYDIPNVRWDSYAVYTNRPRYGAFRGFGKPEINWAIERHMDHVADELGLDPLEYRARNLLREGDRNSIGETLGPNDTEGCLRRPVERLQELDPAEELRAAGLDDRDWRTGLGFAYANKSVARAAASVTVAVRRGMHVEVHVGAADIGQGSDTVFTQMAADAFGVPLEKVHLVTGDTDRSPYTRGPTGSRFTYHAGHAIRLAAERAKAQLADLAAGATGGDPDDFDVVDGRVVDTRHDRAVDVDELFSDYDHEQGASHTVLRAGGELIASATFDSRDAPDKHACWTPIGAAVLVAVSEVTGEVRVLRAVTAADVGRAINPKNVEQQLEGGLSQGLSSAIYEEIAYDGGQVTNPNFKDYRIPGATELPYHSETIVLESHDDGGPHGAKGVGEAGVLPAAPAVGNAVRDAIGVDFDVIPMSPERVLEALDAAE